MRIHACLSAAQAASTWRSSCSVRAASLKRQFQKKVPPRDDGTSIQPRCIPVCVAGEGGTKETTDDDQQRGQASATAQSAKEETLDDMFDQWAAEPIAGGSYQPGVHEHAEPPTKLLTVGEGSLYLSGVPTDDCLHLFPRCGRQINCTDKQDPTKINVQGRRGGKDKKGVTIPGAHVMDLERTGTRRSEQFEEVLAATKPPCAKART